MANKNIYATLLFILVITLLTGIFLVIEAIIFDTSIIGGIIGNVIVALIFFLMYMANKHDALVSGGAE